MKYAAKIKYDWGTTEEKYFDTKEQRNNFLDQRQEIIDSVTLFMSKNQNNEKSKDNFYCTSRNWSDYEMDMYL